MHIARTLSTTPIFASAFLSELYAEGRIKISNMKVGSSPLYFLHGQEALLENFIEHLNQKEKEAFHLLKKEKILFDESQTPVIRIALRALKDFAIPIKTTIKGEPKGIWKYHLLTDKEFVSLVELSMLSKSSSIIQEIPPQIPQHTHKPITQEIPESQSEKPIPIAQTAVNEIPVEKPIKKMKARDFEFSNKIKEYLQVKDIELLSIIEEKKKEFSARIRIDMPFGKQEYLLVAKDKKRISEIDLAMAHQKAQLDKILTLVMSPGDLDKKAIEYVRAWRNLVKFEKIKV